MPGKKSLAGLPALIRFWDKVVRLPSGCWLWTGAAKSQAAGSYPMFCSVWNKSPQHAVAYAYKAIRGLEPPKRGSGLELSHTCETGSRCCNPFHVVEEDHRKNMLRVPKEVRALTTAKARSSKVIRIPTCHPQAKHLAKGLCRTCYVRALRLKHPEWQIKSNERHKARYASDPEYRAAKAAYYKVWKAKKKAEALKNVA